MGRTTCVCLLALVLFGWRMQTGLSSPQTTDTGALTVHIDPFQMTDGPVRLRDATLSCAVLLGGLLISALFWQFRNRWIRVPSRVLGGIVGFLGAISANTLRKWGIGWPSVDFNNGEPSWVFSRSADQCFLLSLVLLTILGLILVSTLTRKFLPGSVLQSSGGRNS